MQVDEEPPIRANTTILLGNLAPYLGEATQKRVLLNAFSRALKDGFPPARIAGLKVLEKATHRFEHFLAFAGLSGSESRCWDVSLLEVNKLCGVGRPWSQRRVFTALMMSQNACCLPSPLLLLIQSWKSASRQLQPCISSVSNWRSTCTRWRKLPRPPGQVLPRLARAVRLPGLPASARIWDGLFRPSVGCGATQRTRPKGTPVPCRQPRGHPAISQPRHLLGQAWPHRLLHLPHRLLRCPLIPQAVRSLHEGFPVHASSFCPTAREPSGQELVSCSGDSSADGWEAADEEMEEEDAVDKAARERLARLSTRSAAAAVSTRAPLQVAPAEQRWADRVHLVLVHRTCIACCSTHTALTVQR
jgi:hypothetical protein